MSDAFVAEIRMFGCNFAPVNWAACDGQLVPIRQNPALFSLLGTTYGGNGTTTFGLPNLQGIAPMQQGAGAGLTPRPLGDTGGTTTVTLGTNEMPVHTHAAMGAASSDQSSPAGNVWGSGQKGGTSVYVPSTPSANSPMNPQLLTVTGGGGPHNNVPPFMVVNFCIALQGIFPQRP